MSSHSKQTLKMMNVTETCTDFSMLQERCDTQLSHFGLTTRKTMGTTEAHSHTLAEGTPIQSDTHTRMHTYTCIHTVAGVC